MSAGLEMLSALSPTERIEFLSGLPAEEAKEILEIVDELDLREMRSKCSTNFMEFVHQVWPDFINGRHH